MGLDIELEEGNTWCGATVTIYRGDQHFDLTRWEAVRLLALLEEIVKARGWR
jgi:hypothetical protein